MTTTRKLKKKKHSQFEAHSKTKKVNLNLHTDTQRNCWLFVFKLLVNIVVVVFCWFRTPAVIHNFTSLCRLIVHQNPDSLPKHRKKYVNDFIWLFYFALFSLYLYFYFNFVVVCDLNVCICKLFGVPFFGPLINRFLFSFVFLLDYYGCCYYYYFGVQSHLEVSMTGFFFLCCWMALLCLRLFVRGSDSLLYC